MVTLCLSSSKFSVCDVPGRSQRESMSFVHTWRNFTFSRKGWKIKEQSMQCDFRNGLALGRCISDITLISYKRGEFPTQITSDSCQTKVERQGITRGVATAQTFVEQTVIGTEESGHSTSWCRAAALGGDPACWRPQPGWVPSTFIHLASTPGTYSL